MKIRLTLLSFTAAIALCLTLAGSVRAEEPIPRELNGVGLDNKLGNVIPMDLTFADENGEPVLLNKYFQAKKGHPVVIIPVYFTCPSLCNFTLNGVVEVLKSLKYTPGQEFEVVTVSFDPAETPQLAKAKKTNYINTYGRPEAAAGWHFLTGDQQNISRLMDALGFRYKYDKKLEQYAHSSATYILTDGGKISRYFSSIYFEPKDLKLALVEASSGKIGTIVDKLILFCCSYDPQTGKYTMVVMQVVRVAGCVTFLALAWLVGGLFLWERRKNRLKSSASAELPPQEAPVEHPGAHGLHAR